MKILAKEYEDTFGMSTVRGAKVTVSHRLPFSFYFSSRRGSHGIHVKPLFNPDKMIIDRAGNLELHGEWKYTPGPDDKNVKPKQKSDMINFFRYYKVLFASVWEEALQEDVLQDYFRGLITFHAMLREFDFYDEYSSELDKIRNIQDLESLVRENEIFNMND